MANKTTGLKSIAYELNISIKMIFLMPQNKK